MKIQVTFKDPDGVTDSITDFLPTRRGRYDSDWGQAFEETLDDLSRWIRGCEYITIEFDTEAGTATVVENER